MCRARRFRLNRPQFRKILRRRSPPFQRQSDLFRREHAPRSRRQGAEFEIADADPFELYGGSADGGGDAADFPFFPFIEGNPVAGGAERLDGSDPEQIALVGNSGADAFQFRFALRATRLSNGAAA